MHADAAGAAVCGMLESVFVLSSGCWEQGKAASSHVTRSKEILSVIRKRELMMRKVKGDTNKTDASLGCNLVVYCTANSGIL